MHRSLSKRLLLGLGILAFVLSACAKHKEANGTELNLSTPANIKGMDPAGAEDTYSAMEVLRVYEGLLEYHPFKRPYTLVPLLAESMPKIAKGGTEYIFKIRKGVLFQNDIAFPLGKGRELKAADFVYSLKRLADPKVQATGWWLLENRVLGLDEWRATALKTGHADYSAKVDGLQAPDDTTLIIKLKKPVPQFLYALAMPYSAAVAQEVVEKYGSDFLNHPVGTGPFQVISYKPKEEIDYIKNPTYWGQTYPTEGALSDKEAGLLEDAGKKLPLVDRVSVRVIIEDQPRWLHFLQGDLDINGVPKDNFGQAIDENKNLRPEFREKGMVLSKDVGMDLTYTAFNTDSDEIPQFRNKHVRQAISLALDNREAIHTFYNDMATFAQTPIPPGIPGYDPNFKNPYRTNDLVLAKKLLADAGYPDGKGFPEITYDTLADTTSRQMAEYVAKNLKNLGLQVKMNTDTWPTLLERIQRRQTQLWGLAWGADYPDAENFLQLFYGPNAQPGGMNGAYYRNKEYDRLFEKARSMPDSPERTRLYRQLAQMVAEDCPVVLDLHRIAVTLHQPWLRNWKHMEFANNGAKYLGVNMDLKRKLRK